MSNSSVVIPAKAGIHTNNDLWIPDQVRDDNSKFSLRSNNNQFGQSMLELIIVVAVGIVVISALVFSTISSIRNSQLSKNQSQATRLAQEGLEKLRSARERGENVVSFGTFSSIWDNTFICPPGINCYFNFNSSGVLQSVSTSTFEVFSGDLKQFTRQVLIEESGQPNEKKFTVKVFWTDFAGQHESKQTTLLSRQ